MKAEHVNNLSGENAAKKIAELIEHGRICMMHTALDQRPIPSRPMGIQKIDGQGRLLFLSSAESDKYAELATSDEMQISVSNEDKSEYMNLYGHAEVYRDQAVIDELYSPFANNWFEGKDDPKITIIRFSPESGHYWDSKHGRFVQLLSIVKGAITGKQSDDGVEGDLKP